MTPVVPVLAAPSPRVLWAARNAEVGLALWLRSPLPPLVAQVAALVDGPAFAVEEEGTPAELEAAVRCQLEAGGRAARGPLEVDVAILAGLFSQLTGRSALRLSLRCEREGSASALGVSKASLTLLCCYAGAGVEWQDACGTVRRMPASHVGLFKGGDWPDQAIRAPCRLPAVSRARAGRLLLRLEPVAYV